MPPTRCPSCEVPLTSEESRGPSCPMCGGSLHGIQAAPAPYAQPAPYNEPRREWERDRDYGDRNYGDYRDRDYGNFRRRDVEVSPELQRARKDASGVLFAIAVLNLICGVVVLAAAPQILGGQLPRELMGLVVVELIAITGVFAGLGWWALYQPLPPAIIGLVLYLLLTLVALASAPEMAGRGIVIRIVFIALLIRAVVVSAKALSPARHDDRY